MPSSRSASRLALTGSCFWRSVLLRRSATIWQQVVTLLFCQLFEDIIWIVLQEANRRKILAYSDDLFILSNINLRDCADVMRIMTVASTQFRIAIATDKIDGAATKITFLGIQLDSALQLFVPRRRNWMFYCFTTVIKQHSYLLFDRTSEFDW